MAGGAAALSPTGRRAKAAARWATAGWQPGSVEQAKGRERAPEGNGTPDPTGIPETFFRAAREETPPQAPERSRGSPGVPASPRSPGRGRAPSPRSSRPPAAGDAPRLSHLLPSPRPPPPARSLTHPRPASAATGASFPRSLPPVKLSPASLRPTPPSRSGAAAAATAPAVPQRRLAPPRSHLGPTAAAARVAREREGGGGFGQSHSAAESRRPARRSLRGVGWAAPPRRDAPSGEGGGGPG